MSREAHHDQFTLGWVYLIALLGTSLYRTKGRFYGWIGRTEVGNNQVGQTVTDPGMVAEARFTDAALENGADWFDSRLSSLFTRVQYSYKGKLDSK